MDMFWACGFLSLWFIFHHDLMVRVAQAVVSAFPYILETEHIYVWGNGSDLSDTSLHVLTVSSTVGFTVKNFLKKTVVLPGYYN